MTDERPWVPSYEEREMIRRAEYEHEAAEAERVKREGDEYSDREARNRRLRENETIANEWRDRQASIGQMLNVAGEAEQALVGSIMLDPEGHALSKVRTFVAPDHFATSAGKIYAAACSLHDKGLEIDAVILRAYCNAPGSYDFTELLISCMETVPSAAHAETYARIVRRYADIRALSSKLHRLQEVPLEPGREDPTAEVVEEIIALQAETFSPGDAVFRDVVAQALDEYSTPDRRLSSGMTSLDAILKTSPGSVTTLAARPGCGKTTFALNYGVECAKLGAPVEMLSLEMGKEELVPIALCSQAEIRFDRWLARTMTEHEFRRLGGAIDVFKSLPMTFHDPEGMKISEFTAWAMRAAAKGAKLLIVDYLQLLEGNPRLTRYEQVSEMTRSVKKTMRRIAKRGYDCRLLQLSQMNRDIEKAEKRKPKLSDLRESGSLEQDSDNVVFLHAPPKDDPGPSHVVEVEVIVAKQRNGPDGSTLFHWHKPTRQFVDHSARLHRPGAGS